jgi:hypothetical protein
VDDNYCEALAKARNILRLSVRRGCRTEESDRALEALGDIATQENDIDLKYEHQRWVCHMEACKEV